MVNEHFYSGTILGITNGFGTIPGWLAPLMAASFTQAEVNLTLNIFTCSHFYNRKYTL